MTAPVTAFSEPQFPLIPDTSSRMYANVSNRLEWIRADGTSRVFAVVVGTPLFSIMQDVLKVNPADDVTMYVADDGGGNYIFGIAWGAEEFCDLWHYRRRTLPAIFR